MAQAQTCELRLMPEDNDRLANLCGQMDQHLRQLEQRLQISISNRGTAFRLTGPEQAVHVGSQLIKDIYAEAASESITPEKIHLFLQQSGIDDIADGVCRGDTVVKTRGARFKARGRNQARYIKGIREYDLSFGIGPAGTGKTYLAVACAVEAFETGQVQRIVLVRPAVEAGENLGFLPGDWAQKVDPYLRPMYDALYEMLGLEKVTKLIERNVIEVAPLAYMRGRTLNESFIVMDEAQNTTIGQMKMFLTRIGFGSKAVVTGDITQIDLPRREHSGLPHALKVLASIQGIHITQFSADDVIRHALVKSIVEAYAAYQKTDIGQE